MYKQDMYMQFLYMLRIRIFWSNTAFASYLPLTFPLMLPAMTYPGSETLREFGKCWPNPFYATSLVAMSSKSKLWVTKGFSFVRPKAMELITLKSVY